MSTSIWDRLYDSTEFPDNIAFKHVKFDLRTGETLPKKSPDNPVRAKASAPLIQGVLSFLTGTWVECGFEVSVPANQDSFVARWRHPDKPKEIIQVRGNFKTRVMESSHPDYDLVSFGALGIGACLRFGIEAFSDAWLALLTNAIKQKVGALTPETVGELSDIAYGALRFGTVWGKTDLGDWTITHVPAAKLEAIKIVNIRNSLGTPEDFETLMEVHRDTTGATQRARFHGEQLDQVKRFLIRKKHTALLGPPGVGKSLCSFEAMRLLGFEHRGIDFQLFTCHEEVKASDLIGAYQPDGQGGFRWVDGPLVRAMTANGGKGQPILVEEFTRMPTKSQNIFISALSDGYIVRNEKPGEDGTGELVIAGPDFVLLADMNVDPAVDDIDLYGAAFARRVRKIEFQYPKLELLSKILRSETGCSPAVATAAAKVYDYAMKVYLSQDVSHPINPGSMVQWVEDYMASVDSGATERVAAQESAGHTWLRDVAGTDLKMRTSFLNEIEGSFRVLEANAKNRKA
jgi:MoxR-like ATPase